MASIKVIPMDRIEFGVMLFLLINNTETLYLINVNRYLKIIQIYKNVMRNNNIKYGNEANEKIINYLKSLDGFVSIYEIRDNQQNRNSLQGMDRLENDINMHLGIDFVLVMKDKTYYLDTKGFKYNPRYYGNLTNGIVDTMLLQVEKFYGGEVRNGWANNPKYLTEYIIILINGYIYFIDYKSLVQYCKKFNRDNIAYEKFNKGYGNYEICIKASVKDMLENKVITCITKID